MYGTVNCRAKRTSHLVLTLSVLLLLSLLVRGKKRKRDASNPSRGKTQSAYTFFVHENYELVRKEHAALSSRDIISILARQWASTNEEEKQLWKYRAEQARIEPYPTIPGMMPLDAEIGPEEEEELDEDEHHDADEVKREAIKDANSAEISV